MKIWIFAAKNVNEEHHKSHNRGSDHDKEIDESKPVAARHGNSHARHGVSRHAGRHSEHDKSEKNRHSHNRNSGKHAGRSGNAHSEKGYRVRERLDDTPAPVYRGELLLQE